MTSLMRFNFSKGSEACIRLESRVMPKNSRTLTGLTFSPQKEEHLNRRRCALVPRCSGPALHLYNPLAENH